jgi:hypothetical protein
MVDKADGWIDGWRHRGKMAIKARRWRVIDFEDR